MVVLAALGSLVVGGCGEDKMTASETENVLRRSAPGALNVTCRPVSEGWDYDCSYDYRDRGVLRHSSINVRVDNKRITSRSAP